jgi:hypothetical protein
LPDPVAPDWIDAHVTLLVAVHAQPVGAVTVTVCCPPATPNTLDGGAIENVHPETCVTLTTRPATVTDPERCGPVFAATVKPAVPDPEPLPAVMETHGVVVLDVQAHPAPAVTLDVRAPPLAGTLA